MADYRLTKVAQDDLLRIAEYTIETFGIEQARAYRDSLIEAFELIAENPRLGRDCSEIRLGYRRLVHGRHLIFYKTTEAGVLIAHILNASQEITKNRF